MLTRSTLLFCCGLWCAATLAQAQTETIPLAGKTVHLYNPFTDLEPVIDLSGTGFPMQRESGNWYVFALDSAGDRLASWLNAFNLRTAGYQETLGKDGLGKNGAFSVTDFGTSKEIWIMVDPHGPTTAAPTILTSPPRMLHVLNPWPLNGPEIVLNGARKPMLVTEGHCGWFTEYILTDGPVSGYFSSVADGENWGQNGYDDNTPFDFSALFAQRGREIWIMSASEVSATFPGTEGSCTYLMAATVHDMAKSHPDYGPGGGGLQTGMVQSQLGPDRKPVPTASAPMNFSTWFNSDPNKPMPLKGAETCVDLEMGKSYDGLWEYDSYNTPAKGYFPIDDFNTLDQNSTNTCYRNPTTGLYTTLTTPHNFGFCMESHANFVYKKGQVFEFRGDDDVWVFINGKLALDLGGVHEALPGKILLDTLGLVEGQTYPWDFFFCERKECSSSLRIKTTIYFKQQRAIDHTEEKLPNGGSRIIIKKFIGGSGACGSSSDTLQEVPPGPLTFTLYGPNGAVIQDLPAGVSFGGITVQSPTVSYDTSKITGLAPGTYRIVFYETANPKVRDEVRFQVSARNIVEFDPPYTVSAVAGNAVKVIAANRYKGDLVAQAAPWKPVFPAGALVYADSARTTPVLTNASLMTSASGFDTLWVFGNPEATAVETFTLSITGSTKAVNITFTLPPLRLPKALDASVFDDDGDGRADRLAVRYDTAITAALPKSIAYRWPAQATAITVPGDQLGPRVVAESSLVFRGTALTTEILTTGSGLFTSTYLARGRDSVQTLPIVDRMGPILQSAIMALGPNADTLYLTFSEPVAKASQSISPAQLFGFYLDSTGTLSNLTPAATLWGSDDLSVTLIFNNTVAPFPKAGNRVTLIDGAGLITDAAGNRPGAQTRAREITGALRTGIQTLQLAHIDRNSPVVTQTPFTLTRLAPTATIADAVQATGRHGHLLEVDLANLAAGDGFNPPNPADVILEYETSIYTNLGSPVAAYKNAVSCTHGLFNGDCRTNRGRLFSGWNYTAKNGQVVGTGAYVVLFRYQVRVQGHVKAEGTRNEKWGVLRRF